MELGDAFTMAFVESESPVTGLHLKVLAEPVTVNVAESPRQIVALLMVICGRGLTIMRIVFAAELHALAIAVTLIVAVCTVVVLLTAVKLAMLPVPEAASPIVVLLLVQLKLEVGVAEKVMVPVALAAHSVMSPGMVSVGGLGFTSVIGPRLLDTQPFKVTLILV